MTQPSLFPDLVPLDPPVVEQLSAGQRLTLRQRGQVAVGIHPLRGGRVSTDPEARCGNCCHRLLVNLGTGRDYPKCLLYGLDSPLVTHGPATDVRAWWPACPQHQYGDNALSVDAYRSGPAPQ